MPQEWDEYGKPITQGSTGPVQEWDEHGTPISGGGTGGDAQGPKGAPQPTSAQLGIDPISSHAGGMAREGALGFASSFSGLPESQHPLKDAAQASMEGNLGYDIGRRIADPSAPGYLDMVKKHNPFQQAIDTGKGLYESGKEMATAPDVEGIAHGAGSFVGQLLQLSTLMKSGDKVATPQVSAAARLVERHAAINQGQVKVVNSMVRGPIQMLEAKVGEEIGRHANAVIAADELHNKVTNNPAGYVDAVEAVGNAAKKSEQIGGDFAPKVGKMIEKAQVGPMTMRDAKALTSQVGAAMRDAPPREVAVLAELYDGLHKATASRADDLGSAYAKSWQHYITETSSLKDLQSGVMGKLMDEPNHAKVLDHLINPDNSAAVKEITKKMKQYNVDSRPLLRGQEIASDLNSLSQETKNAFVGKIRSIMKYPYAAGSGAAAASVVGHLSRIPGMGFVLPLIVAGKIGGMLDQAAVRNILKEVNKAVPAELGNVHKPGEGPMPTPPPPTSSLKMSTDSMGIKWAEDPLTGYKVSIPSRIAEGDVEAYARPKLQEQADIHGKIKGATPGQADDMADLQQSEEESRLDKAQRVRSIYKGRRR